MNVPLITLVAFAFSTILAIFLTRRKKKSTLWHWLLLIGAPLIVVAVAGGIEISRQNRESAPFEPYLEAYLTLPGENEGEPLKQILLAHPTGEAYVKGKIIPVSVRHQQVDLLYFDLPQETRAKDPGEVGTVVWLDCTSVTLVIRRVGASTNNTVNYNCEVAVIDYSIPAIVARQAFQKTSGEQGIRDVLYPQIIEYLESLPRQ